jgi:hypothetical protein
MDKARETTDSPSLLRIVESVLALPRAPFFQEGRETDGLIWDTGNEAIISETLPAVFSPRPQEVFQCDRQALHTLALRAWAEADVMESPAIYGGYLLRHFGHFLHESLSRLWWLAPTGAMASHVQEVSERLQRLEAEVVFFMPKWPAPGEDLLPYMQEILSFLRLPADRIRILERPLRFSKLFIPAFAWGFAVPASSLDDQLGCDSRALMRNLLASAAVPTAPVMTVAPAGTQKVYVTRSGLPLQMGRLIGDVALDPLLQARGYMVFHPESASLVEQIQLYAKAKDLIFMDGSSLYLLWFARLRKGTRVRVILRRRQGRWLCEKVRELLPQGGKGIRWQVVDGLQYEALTSEKDWESHNVAALSNLLRQLSGKAPRALPATVEAALDNYAETFVDQSTPEQLARVLRALIATLATQPRGPSYLRGRLYHTLRGFMAALRK